MCPFGRTARRRNGRPRAAGAGPKDGRIVRAARIPQDPGADAELLGGADLLPDVTWRVPRRAQSEGLEVGPDLGGAPQRLGAAGRVLHGAPGHLVRLAVGRPQAVV